MVDDRLIADELLDDLGGRPDHEPTDATRARVSVLADNRVPRVAIAADLGISKNTLKKHYARELLASDVKVKSMIGNTLLRVGLGSPAEYYPTEFDPQTRQALPPRLKRAETVPDKTVLIFLGKTVLGLIESVALMEAKGDINPEDAVHDTAGLTESERAVRLVGLVNTWRARRDASPHGRPGRVAALPGKSARGSERQRG